jgi:hypothetical protein
VDAAFDMTLPPRQSLNLADMTAEKLDAEMERGPADILARRVRPAADVFADVRKTAGKKCFTIKSSRKGD